MQTITFNPFNFFAAKLDTLFLKAAASKDPAWFLFQHNARGHLFMLEALTKLYINHTDNKALLKWHLRFKKLEDSLGVIDYYEVFIREFKTNKKISKEIIAYPEKKRDQEIKRLNALLTKKGWLDHKLEEFEFAVTPIEYDKTHISFLKNVISDYITRIHDFVKGTQCHFTELDAQVHELRRKVRWLSMYAQALNGIIQLKKQPKPYSWEKEYISRSVITNPYNKIVKPPKDIQQIYYNEAVFYALSKLISDLGILKDQGLKLDLLSKAICKTHSVNNTAATQKALELLGKKQLTIEQVLEEASALAKHFFVEQKILSDLMIK